MRGWLQGWFWAGESFRRKEAPLCRHVIQLCPWVWKQGLMMRKVFPGYECTPGFCARVSGGEKQTSALEIGCALGASVDVGVYPPTLRRLDRYVIF
jgi:hypothetical protein